MLVFLWVVVSTGGFTDSSICRKHNGSLKISKVLNIYVSTNIPNKTTMLTSKSTRTQGLKDRLMGIISYRGLVIYRVVTIDHLFRIAGKKIIFLSKQTDISNHRDHLVA